MRIITFKINKFIFSYFYRKHRLIIKRKMQFAANISTLFEDITDVCERFTHLTQRTDYEFTAVECQNPYTKTLDQWDDVRREHKSIKWILINSPPIWDTTVESMTIDQYDDVLKLTRDYAKHLNVRKVHLLLKDVQSEAQLPKVIELLSYGAKCLETDGIMCVIEPLSIRPKYYLRSYLRAKDIVNQLKHPNLKIMLDTYHLQRLHGNLTENIESLAPYTGHVQISQVPLRDCPIGDGEINHNYILKRIGQFYNDYIGLEYKNKTTESFEWLKNF